MSATEEGCGLQHINKQEQTLPHSTMRYTNFQNVPEYLTSFVDLIYIIY